MHTRTDTVAVTLFASESHNFTAASLQSNLKPGGCRVRGGLSVNMFKSLVLASVAAAALAAPRVILFTLVDDLGWGDTGYHGNAEIPTPTMDSLVRDEGIELLNHYVYKMCTPSRSSFFSGRLPVHVQQRLDNPEVPDAGVPRNMTAIGHVMKAGGYTTAVVGKWDIGCATPGHMPEGRGFDRSLVYCEHKNDYWDNTLMQSACQAYNPIVDLWSDGAPGYGLNNTMYEEYLFHNRVLDIINNMTDSSPPLFLVYTPHVAHCPLQVPQEQLDKFNLENDEGGCSAQTPYIFPGSTQNDYRCRSQYAAMVNLLDGVLSNITGTLKAKGLWQDTLMVLTADNGAPLDVTESGASSFPLRGGKYSDFQGGILSNSFVSGGYLPAAVRGTKLNGMMHIADWYATFAALAGVDPTDKKAAAAGLPPIDSLNLWPVISGQNETSPRVEIAVSNQTLIQGQWKLMRGSMPYATWQGPQYPNASTPAHPPDPAINCGTGCLFNIAQDLTEHSDVAAENPDIVAAMVARLDYLSKSFFSNNDTGVNICPPGISMPCACWAALNKWNGFFGPYQY